MISSLIIILQLINHMKNFGKFSFYKMTWDALLCVDAKAIFLLLDDKQKEIITQFMKRHSNYH